MTNRMHRFIITGAMALLPAANGCAVYVRVPPPPVGAVFVVNEPPPPRREVIVARPGRDFIWIDGYWAWRGAQYVWVPGVWIQRPVNARRYVPGRWYHEPRGWFWIEGRWEL